MFIQFSNRKDFYQKNSRHEAVWLLFGLLVVARNSNFFHYFSGTKKVNKNIVTKHKNRWTPSKCLYFWRSKKKTKKKKSLGLKHAHNNIRVSGTVSHEHAKRVKYTHRWHVFPAHLCCVYNYYVYIFLYYYKTGKRIISPARVHIICKMCV